MSWLPLNLAGVCIIKSLRRQFSWNRIPFDLLSVKVSIRGNNNIRHQLLQRIKQFKHDLISVSQKKKKKNGKIVTRAEVMQWKITRISLLISSNGIQFQDDTSSTFRGVIAGDPCPHHQLTVLRRSYFHNKYSQILTRSKMVNIHQRWMSTNAFHLKWEENSCPRIQMTNSSENILSSRCQWKCGKVK